MNRLSVIAGLVCLGVSVAWAGPIDDRQAIMKGIAAATKKGAAMAKGEVPFDAAQAKAILQVYIDGAAKMPTLFPEDSKTGGDTSASPKIWEDMAGFKAAFAKFAADAQAGLSASDTASFAKAFGAVTGNCASCHQTYRIKKS